MSRSGAYGPFDVGVTHTVVQGRTSEQSPRKKGVAHLLKTKSE